MKITLRGCLGFKPFDESADAHQAVTLYGRSRVVAAAVVLSALLSLAALTLALLRHPAALETLALGVGASALTAGFEWHAGLRARALNQLFFSVVCAALLWLISAL